MKIFPILLCILSTYAYSQRYPEIPELKSRDFMFDQFIQEVQVSERNAKKNVESDLSIYSYTAVDDDTFFTIVSRCSIWQETFATINRISESRDFLGGRNLLVPTVNGVFIPEKPRNPVEILLHGEYRNDLDDENTRMYTIRGEKFYFLPGRRFSGSVRAFFLTVGMVLPLEKSVLTSAFGNRISPITGKWKFHKGIDLAAPIGSSVFACRSGSVRKTVRNDAVYGNYIVIRHSNGMESLYAHLRDISVAENDHVDTGQVIGCVGVTGLTTGPHLHFEIKVNGEAFDPEQYVKVRK